MGIKDFFVKKVLESKLKGLPQEQRDMITKLVQENPALFEKIGNEIKQREKEGKSETAAAMEVMRKHQGDLQKLMMSR